MLSDVITPRRQIADLKMSSYIVQYRHRAARQSVQEYQSMPFDDSTDPFQDLASVLEHYRKHPALQKQS